MVFVPASNINQRGPLEAGAIRVGWYELDQLFCFYPGQLVVISGITSHGKSMLMLNVLIKLARDQGTIAAAYLPENEGYLRATMRRIWPADDESFDHYFATQLLVQTGIRDRANPSHTIDWLMNEAKAAVKAGAEIIMIDPFNELDRFKPRDMSMTDYIGYCLMDVKDFCREQGVSVVIIAHPTKAIAEGGNQRPPGLYDIDGSAHWANKADNGLRVHRGAGNTAIVTSLKVREIGAGRIGECHFYVDPKTGVFTPMHGAVTA